MKREPIRPKESSLVRHFQAYRKMKPWSFCWRLTLENLFVATVVIIPLRLIETTRRDIGSTSEFFFWGVLLAPVIETLLFQAFPIFVARVLHASFPIQVLVSIVA